MALSLMVKELVLPCIALISSDGYVQAVLSVAILVLYIIGVACFTPYSEAFNVRCELGMCLLAIITAATAGAGFTTGNLSSDEQTTRSMVMLPALILALVLPT